MTDSVLVSLLPSRGEGVTSGVASGEAIPFTSPDTPITCPKPAMTPPFCCSCCCCSVEMGGLGCDVCVGVAGLILLPLALTEGVVGVVVVVVFV